MKGMKLSKEEDRTLREMGIHHPHARTRRRAQGVRLLGKGLTLKQVAEEFEVHLNSVEHWRQCWLRLGLVGLQEGARSGRPPSLSRQQRRALGELAQAEGGTSRSLLQRWLERAKQCELLYFDESGFGRSPPIQSGWMPRGQTRRALSGWHQQRVKVLGALRHDGAFIWRLREQCTAREDVIAFLDDLAKQAHTVCRIVVLDNAGIHKGAPMEEKRRQWQQQGLYLYYLPPYSPELNRIEVLWKQAKYFWRRFVYVTGEELPQEVRSIMEKFGNTFAINFA